MRWKNGKIRNVAIILSNNPLAACLKRLLPFFPEVKVLSSEKIDSYLQQLDTIDETLFIVDTRLQPFDDNFTGIEWAIQKLREELHSRAPVIFLHRYTDTHNIQEKYGIIFDYGFDILIFPFTIKEILQSISMAKPITERKLQEFIKKMIPYRISEIIRRLIHQWKNCYLKLYHTINSGNVINSEVEEFVKFVNFKNTIDELITHRKDVKNSKLSDLINDGERLMKRLETAIQQKDQNGQKVQLDALNKWVNKLENYCFQ